MIFDIAKNKGKDFFPGQEEKEIVQCVERRHPMSVISYIIISAAMFFLPFVAYWILRMFNQWKPLNVFALPESLQLLFILIGSIYYFSLTIFCLVWWVDYYYDVLIITNERLVDIEQKGLFTRIVSELYLLRVQDVSGSTKGLLQSVFGYGDVVVQSAGTEVEFRIANLKHPYEIAQRIMNLHNRLVEEDEGLDKAMVEAEGMEMHSKAVAKSKATPISPSLKIGEILVADGVISKAQLDIALAEQRRVGGRLGSILVRLGYLSEEDLLEALGKQTKVIPFDLTDVELDENVVHIIPEKLARKHCCIAVAKQGKILTVACADPQDEEVIEDVGEAIGFKVAPVISPQISIERALDKYYGKNSVLGGEKLQAGKQQFSSF